MYHPIADMELETAALMQTRGNIAAWSQSLRFAPGWLTANKFPLDKVNNPWPFESQLMNEVLEAFTKKRSPRHEDLLLLTMCSSTGQVCPEMQPSRPESSHNIEALIQAMRQFIHVSPDGETARRFLRHASAATSLFANSCQLVIEANLPYKHQGQRAAYLGVLALVRKEKKRNPAAVCDDARPMTKAQYKKAQQEQKKSHDRTVRGLRNMSKRGMVPYREPLPQLAPSPPISLPGLSSSSSSSPPQPQPQPSSSSSSISLQQHQQHQQHNDAAKVDHGCGQLFSMLQQSVQEEQYQGEGLHQDLLQFIQELELEAPQQQPEAGAAELDLEPAGALELALEEDQQQEEEGFLGDGDILWTQDQEKQQPSEQLPEQDGTCELDAEDQRLFRLLEQALGRS